MTDIDSLATLRQRIADELHAAGGPFANADADTLAAAVLAVVQPEMERLRAEVQVQVDRKMEIAGEWLNDRTDKVAAEKALAEAQADVKRLGAQYTEAMSGARELSEKLREARTTNERLNYRAQTAESRLNTVTVAVANWQVGETGTYVPLHTLAAIAKAVGIHHDTSRWEMHHERVAELEAALARVREVAEDLSTWLAPDGIDAQATAASILTALNAPSPPAP